MQVASPDAGDRAPGCATHYLLEPALSHRQLGHHGHAAAMPAVAGRKRWLTAQARCVLAGLHAALLDGDRGEPLLVVNQGALTKQFLDLNELEQWLRQARPEGSTHD